MHSISHGHAVERVEESTTKSLRETLGPVVLSEKDKAPRFAPYTPLIRTIPVATTKARKMTTRKRAASPAADFSDATGQLDRSILDSIIWSRIARTKSDAVVCVYEAEGGICADTSCSNIHLTRDIAPTREAPLSRKIESGTACSEDSSPSC